LKAFIAEINKTRASPNYHVFGYEDQVSLAAWKKFFPQAFAYINVGRK